MNTRISPDGKEVLFVLAEPDLHQNRYTQSIWKVNADKKAPIKLVVSGSNPRWSPNGKIIAFLLADEGPRQIWLMNPVGENRRQLTEAVAGVKDYYWSPSGKQIAYFSEVSQGTNGDSKTQIHLIDLETKQTRQVTHEEKTIIVHAWDPDANLSWSPDGKEIAFSVKPTPKFDDDYRSHIQVVSIKDGAVKKLVERDGMDMRPVWSPDGKHIAFRSSYGKIDRFANHGMSIVSANGGEPRDIGRDFEGGFLDGPYYYDWSADSKTLYFSGRAPATLRLFAISVETGQTVQVTSDDRVHTRFSLARGSNRMAFLASDPNAPWEIYQSPLDQYKPTRLTETNPHLNDRSLGKTEMVRWKSYDGLEVEGILVKPVGYVDGSKYPVLTILHGGPEGSMLAAFWPELPFPSPFLDPLPQHFFAGQGYAVFLPNFRGSGGYGEAFRRAGSKNWSQGYYDDIMSGLDYLIEQGIADQDKLVISGGWRSGAVKVVGMLTKTERFKAASALTPYVDFVTYYESKGDFHLQHEGLLGGSPQTARAAYEKHAPIFSAQKIKTPTLIVHNENDWLISASQPAALHEVLLKNRVPGEFIMIRSLGCKEDAGLVRHHLLWFNRWLNLEKF